MSHACLGRQPIVNTRGDVEAYELLYRDEGLVEECAITSSVVSNLFSVFGVDKVLGEHIGFVKVDKGFLYKDLLLSMQPERFVFSIFDNIVIDEPFVTHLRQLHAQGYYFALNDVKLNEETVAKFRSLFPLLSFIKIDYQFSDRGALISAMTAFREAGIKVIFTKIETQEEYVQAQSLACDLFQGYFIEKPNLIKGALLSPDQQSVLALWNLLQQDASIDEIEAAFERSPAISIKLLAFVNSAAFALKSTISSIRHVLTLMGREPLAKWIMLMMYADVQKSGTHSAPLLLMVLNRTELMVGLMRLVEPGAERKKVSEAYFTGMISMLPLLFSMAIEDILDKLNVNEDVKNAIIEGKGMLGEMLETVRAIELFDVDAMDAFMDSHGIGYDRLDHLIAEVMQKVNEFESAM